MISNNVQRLRIAIFLACVMVVLSLVGATPGRAGVAPAQLFIRLKAGSFDPLQALPALPARLVYTSAEAASGVYIVQFGGPVRPGWKQALLDAGGQLGDYVPDYAFLARLDAAARERVQAMPFVRWVGPFEPAYKLAADVDYEGARSYRLRLAPWGDAAAVRGALDELAVKPRGYEQVLVAVLDGSQLEQVARLADVLWIEPLRLLRTFNDVGGGDIMGGMAAWDNGYSGEGVIVSASDSGLDTGNADTIHQDFSGRVAHISSWPVLYADYGGGCVTANVGADDGAADLNSGHGTHVTGSMAGDGARSGGQFKGLGHGATVAFQAVEQYTEWTGSCSYGHYQLTGIPGDVRELLNEAYDWGARVYNASWGGEDAGVYDELAAQFDDFVHQHPDMAIVVAAGNSGIDSDPRDGYVDTNSVASPATAKNVISVGALDSERASGGYQSVWADKWPVAYPLDPTRNDGISDDRQELAAFSSRGPTNDGRIKPDVVAPGTNIISTRSSQTTRSGWGTFDDYYVYMGGTSMASPLVAGAVAVVREYYVDTGHPNPSAALIKATLINSAVDISGYGVANREAGQPIPNNHEGWGRVDIAAATSPNFRQVTDHATGLLTGESEVYQFDLQAGPSFKVTLVWSDAPASPSAGPALVNDLDLRVTGPTGIVYRGNNFAGGWSQPVGSADAVNNVENVYIQSTGAGTWTVEVLGKNVPQGPQPFALLASWEELTLTGFQLGQAFNNAVLSDIVVSGTGFAPAATVYLARDVEEIAGSNLRVDTDADTITADFDLRGATPGSWDVRVNNSSTVSVVLPGAFTVLAAPFPNLRVSKMADRSTVEVGDWMTYTIVISNAGHQAATGIVFTDVLPLGVTFERLTPPCAGGTAAIGTATLSFGFVCQTQPGSLLMDDEIEYTLVVYVTAEAQGLLTNRVNVGSTEADLAPDDNSDQVSVQVLGSGSIYLPLVCRNWFAPGTGQLPRE
jgi:uncharacterized repeat protein (TIGR01451 family)